MSKTHPHEKNQTTKTVAQGRGLDHDIISNSSLFENPLRKEFLTFDQVVGFFGYSKSWVRQQMTAGNLPYRTYGRDGVLFYVPEVRQAILDGRLAPMRRKVQHDKNEKKETRGSVRSDHSIQGAKTLKDLRSEVAFWSKDEKETFLYANRESQYYPLFFFLLHTGVRIGEAFGAHAEQIHRTNQLFMVDRQLATYEDRIVYETKGRRTRTLYLIDDVMSVLQPIPLSGILFKTPQGYPMHYSNFYNRIFPKACKRADVKNIGPHGTRHTFAAHYMMDGGNLWDLSKILGHSSIEVTEKRYGHFDLAHVKSRMKILERKGNVVKAQFG